MGRKIEPTYLGDGVYATEDDRGIVLTTGTHVITEADNVIVLEPKVWAALKRWAEPSKDEEPTTAMPSAARKPGKDPST